jgi:hypothetical protein
MPKNNKKGPRYLDVADFMLTGPFSPKFSPGQPAQQEQQEVSAFNTRTARVFCSPNDPYVEQYALKSTPLHLN